jgi:endonuclease/exonuclease/phosphatase family metal-dependent hydrolase
MLSHLWRARLLSCAFTRLVFVASMSMLAGCVGNHALAVRHTDGLGPGIQWFGPEHAADVVTLDAWRMSVGPPLHVSRSRATPSSLDALTLVSWNTALGAGDVERLVSDMRRRRPGVPIVLLLQEVYRGGPEVPTQLSRTAAFAARLKGRRADGRRDDVETLAMALDMSAYYVPSMRNGSPLLSDEDRGNAILSTLPLSHLTAFELPFERQRRVAVGATLTGDSQSGKPWQLRVVSAHLDNMAGAKRLWIGSELGRVRQTRGLMHQLIDGSPIVLGGDFNTWFGFADQAFRETARLFPDTRVTDRRPTFRGWLRLDHLFFRLPAGWTGSFRRADDRYGSDHYPLVATIELPA